MKNYKTIGNSIYVRENQCWQHLRKWQKFVGIDLPKINTIPGDIFYSSITGDRYIYKGDGKWIKG